MAETVGAGYLAIGEDGEIDENVRQALARARQKEPMLVEVNIDYSRKTYFTKGILTTNFWRLSWGDRLRMASRAVKRRITG